MPTLNKEAEIVTYQGMTARITPRTNGWFIVRWREAKQGRSTTCTTLSAARILASKKVRELAAKSGSRMVTVLEAETAESFRELCGARSMTTVMDLLRSGVDRCGGWDGVGRAIEEWLRAGHGVITREPVSSAVKRFLTEHAESAVLYKAGLRKELEAYAEAYSSVSVCDISEPMLLAWISRGKPGPRYFNNRLATWKTFLNRCRVWNYVVKGKSHPAEVIKRAKEEDSAPEILTGDQATKALAIVKQENAQLLPYLVIGGWMGLRPFELTRITWDAWDWDRGYLDVGAKVAKKVMQQRFVPIPANVLAMRPQLEAAHRNKAKCCRRHDREDLSILLKQHEIIKEWPQDVLRHSYISYQLALGHGRGQVAEWAGNSEQVIRKSYRRPLRKQDGETWCKIGL